MQVDTAPEAPAEWPRRAVGDIAEVNPAYPLVKGREYPFVEMASVAENFGGVPHFDRRVLEASGLSRFKLNDVLKPPAPPAASPAA